MYLILLMAVIWASWRYVGVPGRYILVTQIGVWLAAVAVLALWPASTLARLIGGTAEIWLLAGGLALLALAYRSMISRLKAGASRAGHQGAGMISDAPIPEQASAASPEAGTFSPTQSAAQALTQATPGGPMSDAELERYARHIVLRELGGPGQGKLRRANVLIVGAGALGAPVALYLAAAGVGRITLADDDQVSLSNLQRQVIFRSSDAGRDKVLAAAQAMTALNPYIQVSTLNRRISADDAALVRGFDLVLDGTDSFAARFGINAACAQAGVPLIAGSIAQWEGQLTVWDPARNAPCLACIFPQPPAAGLAPSCAEAGVVGALPGVIGSMMALEAIKLITGAGSVARGEMTIFDGLWGESRKIRIHRRDDCAICQGISAAQ